MDADPSALKDQYDQDCKTLNDLTEIVKNPNLASVKRKILVSLITVEVHNRDIVEKLMTD